IERQCAMRISRCDPVLAAAGWLSTAFHKYGDVLSVASGRPKRLSSPRGGADRVPRHSPFHIDLTRDERRALETRARTYTSPYRDVIRAKLVLLAAEGLSNDVIAARLDTPRQIISHWRKRFFDQRLAGLD